MGSAPRRFRAILDKLPEKSILDFSGPQSEKCDFRFAPVFKHLSVRKLAARACAAPKVAE
jgi:hypothetical protein